MIWIALLIIIAVIILPSCTRSVTLYFTAMKGDEFYLVPEKRQIDTSGNIYLETIRQLATGPEGRDLYPTIPSDTVVNSVEVSGGLAVVDFGINIISNFQEIPHSSTTEILAIYSIVNTLTNFDEIERVRITIEGMEKGEINGFYVEDFWGHLGISQEFTRNVEIIRDE